MMDQEQRQTELVSEPDGRSWIEEIALFQFRNYLQFKLALDPRPVVLAGENGAGKTNLLEAVSLLSPGQGLRRASTAELANFQADGDWAVSARVHGVLGEVQVGTGITGAAQSETLRRKIRIDGESQSSSISLARSLQILWLTPQMDGLFTGSASERRRFLDRLTLVFNPEVRKQWNLFERAMRQRNKLLEVQEGTGPLLDGLEMQMAEHGVVVAASRMEAIDRLRDVIRQASDKESAFPFATLLLEGRLEQALELDAAVDVEDEYRRILRNNRGLDRAAKRTMEGPHRTDLIVGHGPKERPARLCSTGEQKALLTGLVLAQARLVHERAGGFAPLLLLDEIAAHFDEKRRCALFDEILKLQCQAWMTGTGPEAFTYLQETAQILTVEDGRIAPV